MTPYYEDGRSAIFHASCLDLFVSGELVPEQFTVLVTDPPYGIDYQSNRPRTEGNARSIAGDKDATLRDEVIGWWGDQGPALVFGSWRIQKPGGTKGVLVWDKGGALGMGDLSLPWKFDHEEVYVLGRGFTGKRDCGSVLRVPPVQSMGRFHPHQKPVELMTALLSKCPPGAVLDPFCGSGSTLVAAKALGRVYVGVEKDERYCEIAAKRLAQGALDLGGVA